MSLVIDLPPETEAQVMAAANAEGVDVTTYFYETVKPRLRSVPPENMSDVELLAKVREDFPAPFWKRFSALTAKRDNESLTPAEWKELASSAEAVEAHDAERLFYLTELSRRRGRPARLLMAELGLRSGSDA